MVPAARPRLHRRADAVTALRRLGRLDRPPAQSLRLFEAGYAAVVAGRFLQTMEHAIGKPPRAVAAGPFAANTGGFLSSLLCGLSGIRVSPDDPATWACRPVVLPAGSRSISSDRLWVRGRPASLVAEHGMERAALNVGRRG